MLRYSTTTVCYHHLALMYYEGAWIKSCVAVTLIVWMICLNNWCQNGATSKQPVKAELKKFVTGS